MLNHTTSERRSYRGARNSARLTPRKTTSVNLVSSKASEVSKMSGNVVAAMVEVCEGNDMEGRQS